MEKAKLIITIVSLVFVVLCLGASVYFSAVLPQGDENLSTFYIMDVIFAGAAVWFAFNIRSIIKG